MNKSSTEAQENIKSVIQRIATGPELSKNISRDEAKRSMSDILNGEIDPVQSAIFLIALRMKRETMDENLGVHDAIIESLLVLDASQGQNGLKQAKSFAKSADLSGAIITKLDGTSRGGVSLAVSEEVNLPIRFIGAGEGIKDLRPFNSYEN